MACSRVSLPSLRLIKRPTFSSPSITSFQRGVYDPIQRNGELDDVQPTQVSPAQSDTSDEFDNTVFNTDDNVCDLEEPTCYELESRSMVAGWNEIRESALNAITETAAMPLEQACINCNSIALLRCRQCGPLGFYCLGCFQKYHKCVNFLHIPEKWEDDCFMPLLNLDRHVDVKPMHGCSSKREILIHCLDSYGIEHKVWYTFCDCEPIAVTLTRASLWPSTPHNPRYAFTFALLDWAEALMLECQVALKDFCSALKFRCPFDTSKARRMYSALINSFEEYRCMKHNMRHLTHISNTLDSGNVCPACPQKDGGKRIFAMDALFGLPRKKSAGVSYRFPLIGELFFFDQTEVDQFIALSENSKSKRKAKDTQCSDFVAGSTLRSASRYAALDETALFGYCCRHEFPGRFINLKHGERLGYALWIVEDIVKRFPGSDLYIMYDIACSLTRHLELLDRTDILETTHLCVPTFHSFGHQVSCQVVFGPRRCVGIGLSDGETMERLWSYLRRFSRMTKEMRPSHRIDVLCSALIFYGIKTKEKLTSLLLIRWKRALKTKEVAEEAIQELMPGRNCHDKVLQNQVDEWLAKEMSIHNDTTLNSKIPKWQVLYFYTLQSYYLLRNQVSHRTSDNRILYHHMIKLDNELKDMEEKHVVPARWLPSDKRYEECERTLLFSKSEQLLLHIWKASQRRVFLLELKRKYADGQKIAKRLCLQIKKETKTIKSLLAEYDACQSISNSSSNEFITMEDALSPSVIKERLQRNKYWSTLFSGKEREVIDAYLMFCRSVEELEIIKEESRNVILYYESRRDTILSLLDSLSTALDSYSRGAKALLMKMKATVIDKLHLAYDTDKRLNSHVCNSDEDDFSEDSDTDSSNDSCSDGE